MPGLEPPIPDGGEAEPPEPKPEPISSTAAMQLLDAIDRLRAAIAQIQGARSIEVTFSAPVDTSDREAFTRALAAELMPVVDRELGARYGGKSKPDHILQFFAYEHLPAKLAAISKPFCEVAHAMVEGDNGPASGNVTFGGPLPRNPERTVALRKLLEAKDAAVRAAIAHD